MNQWAAFRHFSLAPVAQRPSAPDSYPGDFGSIPSGSFFCQSVVMDSIQVVDSGGASSTLATGYDKIHFKVMVRGRNMETNTRFSKL